MCKQDSVKLILQVCALNILGFSIRFGKDSNIGFYLVCCVVLCLFSFLKRVLYHRRESTRLGL